MMMKYITKIKANIMIYSGRKSTNLLDGTYNSVYKGKSSNFEDLREYVIGDNIKDIDWKASARSPQTLVRQYRAEKKHNIMVVVDTGKKMLADTQNGESKNKVALLTAGTISYIASKNGDYVGSIYNKEREIKYFPFKLGFYNIEKILANYEKDVLATNTSYLENNLKYIIDNIKRKMILFIISDIDGMNKIQDSTLKRLSLVHDVLFININDAYITGDKAYDMDTNFYIPKLLLRDKKLYELEKKARKELYENCKVKLKKYNIQEETIDSEKEIVTKIINLLERHKHANIR